MSEKVSETLLNMIDSICDMELTMYKINGAIFVRNNEKLIKNKIEYLYNLLQAEAQKYSQKQDRFLETTNLIIAHYTQKLNMVYDEFYCQYVNIQSEIQDARANQKISMVNYQKVVNDVEKNKISLQMSEKLKQELKDKYDVYEQIIEKCKYKFNTSRLDFENRINREFLIMSSIDVVEEGGFLTKVIRKITNIFKGNERYDAVLKRYNKKVDNIDSRMFVDEMREDTISFVEQILELRQSVGLELEEVV
mgnify:CR=1 FL=1